MAVKAADKIKRARVSLGLSQGELADLSGVDRATLSRWETGKAKPTKAMMAKLSPHLGIEAKPEKTAAPEGKYVQTLGYFMAEKKLTAEELAKKSGVSESVISGIRNGKLPCVSPWVSQLARALNVGEFQIYNNVPGACEYIGEGLQAFEKKYPRPEAMMNYWGDITTVKGIAPGPCGWCGLLHEGLACKEDDID